MFGTEIDARPSCGTIISLAVTIDVDRRYYVNVYAFTRARAFATRSRVSRAHFRDRFAVPKAFMRLIVGYLQLRHENRRLFFFLSSAANSS